MLVSHCYFNKLSKFSAYNNVDVLTYSLGGQKSDMDLTRYLSELMLP